MAPINLFGAGGVLEASALLLNPTGASQFLRSANSKAWGSPCLAKVTPCLAKQPLKLPCSACVDGPGHLTGTGTSKMEVEGGGYAWGGLNATCRLWKSLCKTQVFVLEGLRYWSGLCSWLGGQAWLQGPSWELPTGLLWF